MYWGLITFDREFHVWSRCLLFNHLITITPLLSLFFVPSDYETFLQGTTLGGHRAARGSTGEVLIKMVVVIRRHNYG